MFKRWGVLILLGLVILFSSVRIVPQGYFGVKLDRSGKTASPMLNPGLHWHWPWIQSILLLDEQAQTLVVDGSSKNLLLTLVTFDKYEVNVAYALVWRVTDRNAFYKSALFKAPMAGIRTKVDQALTDQLQTETMMQLTNQASTENNIQQALRVANKNLSSSGVSILSVFITSVALSENERPDYVAHMQEQQNGELLTLQKQTEALGQKLRDQGDAKAHHLLSDGEMAAAKIKADADLEATAIYAQAYHKNPEFYEYFHNLQLYKKLFNTKQDTLILSTHNAFLKGLVNKAQGENKSS